MHYFVVGVNGSGKSTLLKTVSEQTGVEVVHGTQVLMRHLGIDGDYDALRALDQAYVLEKWAETAESLVETHRDESFLLDTHILNLTNGTVIRRDGPWIGRYDALVLVKAEPGTILQRVTQGTARYRALFPDGIDDNKKLAIISEYQQRTEALFHELAREYALPSRVLFNDGPEVDRAVAEFVFFHKACVAGNGVAS